MTCQEMKRRMELPVEQFTFAELREMWQHTLCCEACKESFGWQLQLSWLLLDAMEEPPPGFTERVMAAVSGQKTPTPIKTPWWKRRRVLAALAAALVVVVLSPAALRAVQQDFMAKSEMPEMSVRDDAAVNEMGPVASSFALEAPTSAESENQANSLPDERMADGTSNGMEDSSRADGESAIAGYGVSDSASPVAENDLFASQASMKTYAAASRHTIVDWHELLPTELVQDPSQVTVVIYSALPPEEYEEHVAGKPVDCYVVEATGGYALYLVRD